MWLHGAEAAGGGVVPDPLSRSEHYGVGVWRIVRCCARTRIVVIAS